MDLEEIESSSDNRPRGFSRRQTHCRPILIVGVQGRLVTWFGPKGQRVYTAKLFKATPTFCPNPLENFLVERRGIEPLDADLARIRRYP